MKTDSTTRILEWPAGSVGNVVAPLEERQGRAGAADAPIGLGAARGGQRSPADARVPIRSGDRGCLGGVEGRDDREGLDLICPPPSTTCARTAR